MISIEGRKTFEVNLLQLLTGTSSAVRVARFQPCQQSKGL